ncbi:MAG: copper chaperone PCu(A)C [Acetobacteraceae bacterium]
MRNPAFLILAAPLLVATVAAQAADIRVEHIWARASAGGASTGAAYFSVTNGGQPDRLVAVATPVAATAELHETTNDNGVMKMRPVGGIPLVPGQTVTLAPGGYHVMLMGLKAPLTPEATFPLTLSFEHAQPVTVTVSVQAMGARGGMGVSRP